MLALPNSAGPVLSRGADPPRRAEPCRWVFVHDLDGTHEDRYFYSTDLSFSPSKILTLYTARWSIEVTFEEVRLHPGFHTPRCWGGNSVLRTGPLLLGLFSLVCLIYHRHTRGKGTTPIPTRWYAETQVSFADAIAGVRGLLWHQTVLQGLDQTGAFQNLPAQLQRMVIHRLSYAARAGGDGKSRAQRIFTARAASRTTTAREITA